MALSVFGDKSKQPSPAELDRVLGRTRTHWHALIAHTAAAYPPLDEAWNFWNTFPEFASGPGNFLFDLAIGDGTLPRTPGVGVDNADVVYQFDSDPALTPDEQDFNDDVVRVEADPQGFHSHERHAAHGRSDRGRRAKDRARQILSE